MAEGSERGEGRSVIGVGDQRLWFSSTFYQDYRRLNPKIAEKVSSTTGLIRTNGPRHPSLHTRKIAGHPDGRFHFMNVDDQYRMVVVLEGRDVFFEMVGNHDETLKRGADATLREYEERLRIDPETFVRSTARRATVPEEPTLFGDQPTSLAQIVQEPEVVADLITGDLFGALEGYCDGTIEDWMIFLSPLQRRAVDRNINGPARVTGGPGTGKTVVGLHRAAKLAADLSGPKRVLMTSFVRTIPETLGQLFKRLAPSQHRYVDFRHIHEMAADFLRTRGQWVDRGANATDAARSRFERRFTANPARVLSLHAQGFNSGYLWDEITRVIEGRGITDLTTYLRLQRHGRKRPMQTEARRLTWTIYEEYREACDRQQPRLVDAEWMLQLAYDALCKEPTGQRYQAIVVDEAQDMTEVGLRFLLELLEKGPEGRLILIGDQAQRVYPGGFRLSDIGVDTRGRSFTLRESYRSTDEIMQAVGSLGRDLSAEDYGEDGLASLASSTVRRGSKPVLRRFSSLEEEEDWWIKNLAEADDPDSIGLLLPTNKAVDMWTARLRAAGIPSLDLSKWKGRPTPGVKVGTYHRSKGLEFKRVVLPGLDDTFPWAHGDDTDGILLQGSTLYVAMSRARDSLEMSFAGASSSFLEAIEPYCEADNLG